MVEPINTIHFHNINIVTFILFKVAKWMEDNKFEFLEGDSKVSEESKKILAPAQTQSKLIQLMNSDESCDCIKGWIQVN